MVHSFRGGTHVRHEKQRTAGKPIEPMPLPERLVVPLRQHIGAVPEPIVARGDLVAKGQLLARSDAYVSATVHAPTSGVIKDILELPHPTLGKGMAFVLEPDGRDAWVEGLPVLRDWRELDPDALRELVRAGGVVGLGGAAFPTHVKLSPPAGTVLEHVVVNGAECEPYLTSDDAVMRERAEDLVTGIEILLRITGAVHGHVGIEANKPQALKAVAAAARRLPQVRVVALPTRYPQGAERSILQALLGKWVPAGQLPLSVGAIVQNTTTCVAIADAVVRGIPVIDKVLTVSGAAVVTPRNVLVRIGTSWRDVLAFCGGPTEDLGRLVMGGPMMGVAQNSFDAPVIKASSGLLALSKAEVAHPPEGPCLRCGMCVSVCPMARKPLDFPTMAELHLVSQADAAGILECIECGTCEYACPANRPILQSIQVLKAKVRAARAQTAATR